MGGGGDRALARPQPQGSPELRAKVSCRVESAARDAASAAGPRSRRIRQAPAIARASALDRAWRPTCRLRTSTCARAGLMPTPTRWCASAHSEMLDGAPPNQVWPLVAPLLSRIRCARCIRAALLLAAAPADSRPSTRTARSASSARRQAELVAAQRLNAIDRKRARDRQQLPRALDRAAEAEAELQGGTAAEPGVCAGGGGEHGRSVSATRPRC